MKRFLSFLLAAVMAVGFVAVLPAPVATAAFVNDTSPYKWGFTDFSGVTFTATDDEYFSNNYGIQRKNKTSAVDEWKIDSNALVIDANGGQKGIVVQTNGPSGSDYYWNATNGFNPTVGNDYKITVEAKCDDAVPGKLMIQTNNQWGSPDTTWIDPFAITRQTYELEFTYVSHNIVLDNVDSDAGFTIYSLIIEEIGGVVLSVDASASEDFEGYSDGDPLFCTEGNDPGGGGVAEIITDATKGKAVEVTVNNYNQSVIIPGMELTYALNKYSAIQFDFITFGGTGAGWKDIEIYVGEESAFNSLGAWSAPPAASLVEKQNYAAAPTSWVTYTVPIPASLSATLGGVTGPIDVAFFINSTDIVYGITNIKFLYDPDNVATPTYNISGTITGGTDPLGGATVTLLDAANGDAPVSGKTATTAANGTYTIPSVPAGSYKIKAEKFGYITATSATSFAVTDANVTGRNLTLAAAPEVDHWCVELGTYTESGASGWSATGQKGWSFTGDALQDLKDATLLVVEIDKSWNSGIGGFGVIVNIGSGWEETDITGSGWTGWGSLESSSTLHPSVVSVDIGSQVVTIVMELDKIPGYSGFASVSSGKFWLWHGDILDLGITTYLASSWPCTCPQEPDDPSKPTNPLGLVESDFTVQIFAQANTAAWGYKWDTLVEATGADGENDVELLSADLIDNLTHYEDPNTGNLVWDDAYDNFGFEIAPNTSGRAKFAANDTATLTVDWSLEVDGVEEASGTDKELFIKYDPSKANDWEKWSVENQKFAIGLFDPDSDYVLTYEITDIKSTSASGGTTDPVDPPVNPPGGGGTGGGTVTIPTTPPAPPTEELVTGDSEGNFSEDDIDEALEELKGAENPELILSTPVDKVVIPAAAFENILDSGVKVVVETPKASISLDAKALETVADAGDGDITISAVVVDPDELTEKQKEQVGDRPVYDFTVTNGDTEVSHFKGGKATIEIPYTLKAGENPNAIVVYYLDADGKLKQERGKYIDGKIVFVVTHFSFYVIQYNPITYTDIPTDWAKNAVEFAAARGLIEGLAGDKFNPATKVTRGEFTAMLMNYYGVELDATATDNFSDVADDAPYAAHLATAKKLGIITGTGDNKFNPERNMTRMSMFALLYNILKAVDEVPAPVYGGMALEDFADADLIEATLVDRIAALAAAGLITGNTAKEMKPAEEASRKESSEFIYKLPIQ